MRVVHARTALRRGCDSTSNVAFMCLRLILFTVAIISVAVLFASTAGPIVITFGFGFSALGACDGGTCSQGDPTCSLNIFRRHTTLEQ